MIERKRIEKFYNPFLTEIKMQPIATLMHALSSPADYVFDWRDGELFIEPKVVADTQAADHDQAMHQPRTHRSRIDATTCV